MKLQPESKKELTRIACGTAICTAVMWVVFAALHVVGWVKFDYTVILGSLIGGAVAIAAPVFQPFAGVLPLLFPRVTIYYLQITGKYKPLAPAGPSVDVSVEGDPAPAPQQEAEPRDEGGET